MNLRRDRSSTSASLRERLRSQLADLKMPGTLEALDDRLRRSAFAKLAGDQTFDHLLGSHIQRRNGRRLRTAVRSGRL